MDSNKIIQDIYLVIASVIAFVMLQPLIVNLINRIARINVRSVKNVQHMDQDVEPETQVPSSPILPRGIYFEGFYDKKTIHKKTALAKHASKKFFVPKITFGIFLVLILILLVMDIYQRKTLFSRSTFGAVIITYLIYNMFFEPYLSPYLEVLQSVTKSKKAFFCKGIISSEGIKYTSDNVEADNSDIISWGKIYRAKQTDDIVVLFADYSPSMSFPRKFFKNETDWEQFKRWVNFYVKERQ